MKEILKDICKKSLEKAYEQNLKSIFTSFFYDYKTKDVDYIPQCNPDLYMKDVVVEVLESFVSHDFTVSKMTCSFWDIEEVAKNPTMGNFDAEILLYNILEKDLNIAICDNEALFFLGEDNIYQIIENNFSCFCLNNREQYNKLNRPDIFNAIISAENLIVLQSEGKIKDPNQFAYSSEGKLNHLANLQRVLTYLYGENTKTNTYQKIIEKFLLDLNKIIKTGLDELYEENKTVFVEIVLPIFINKATLNLNNKEKQIIYDYLTKNKDIDKIMQLILTFQYTSKLNRYVKHNEHAGFTNVSNFLDFSFVAVQMFKLVEIVFYDLLNEFWNNNNIVDKYGKVEVSDDKINLGKMNQFFNATDKEIISHLKQKSLHNNLLQEKLSDWISKTRNGFLHKHILSESLLNESVSDSIDIVCLLILVLKK